MKGPSAATLYGTDAANGVIVITTKKGRAGAPRWIAYAEGGILDDRNWYADNYTLAGMSPTGSEAGSLGPVHARRWFRSAPAGRATAPGYDSVRVYSPIKDPTVTPLGYGYRNAEGVQVSGGTDAVRYFMSGGRDDEIGVFKLDPYEKHRYDSLGITIHSVADAPQYAASEQLPRKHQRAGQLRSSTPT